MREVILHIGMNKTGSTSIQAVLGAAGSGPDWTFLNRKEANSSNLVRLAVHPNGPSERWLSEVDLRAPQAARDLIVQWQTEAQTPRCILSGEALFRLGRKPVATLVDLLHGNADRVRAIAYIRAPASFLSSSFQQRMKMGHIPLDQFYRTRQLDYERSSGDWDAVLGRDNVDLLPFVRSRFANGSVVTDFATRLDLGPLLDDAQQSNTGLSAEALRLLVQYRRHVPKRAKQDGRIITALQSLGGDRLRFASNVLAPAREAAERLRPWAVERMAWDMAEPETEDGPRAISRESDFDDLLPDTYEWLAAQTDRPVSILKGDLDAVAEAVGRLAASQVGEQPKSSIWRRLARKVTSR